ncbi:hypothetical protein G6M86_29840 (plasmid) [Agrobacterium tumefaciens]|uniref:Uncharacterized protein n=1 Tax=Agrobacterium tumefaciens TaxID=358 RepID=A0AAJ4NAD9_AGRTU|nr:hypothetical protein G6M86_29840 [Agrobacterium tumefaciens]
MLVLSSSDPRSPRHRTHKAEVCKETLEACLKELIDQHIATLRAMAHAAQFDNDLMRQEAESRQAILHYRPQGKSELNEKLTYIAAYILKTGNVLTPQEMELLLGVPRRM